MCSVCNPEIVSQLDVFLKQCPQLKDLMERLGENQEKMEEIMKKVKQAVSEEEWEKMREESEEEIYGKAGENNDGPTGPGQQPPKDNGNENGNSPGRKPNNNDNSAKINQLQQEVNTLK